MASPTPNHNTHFGVKNINGTSDQRYAHSKSRDGASWLQIWFRETKSQRKTCAVLGCSGAAEVGAHVLITDGRSSNTWHLAPFCKGCNHHTNTKVMWVEKTITLVTVRSDMWVKLGCVIDDLTLKFNFSFWTLNLHIAP
jgi:hypothetical protein